MKPVEIANLFFVPSGILVAAMTVASTDALKTGVSALGLLTTCVWLYCSLTSSADGDTRAERALLVLPWGYGLVWLASLAVHGLAAWAKFAARY